MKSGETLIVKKDFEQEISVHTADNCVTILDYEVLDNKSTELTSSVVIHYPDIPDLIKALQRAYDTIYIPRAAKELEKFVKENKEKLLQEMKDEDHD